MTRYGVGYNGGTKTWEELQRWPQWQLLDPSYQPRAKWILDASIAAGRPVGIGGIARTEATQLLGALNRHIEVSVGQKHCCTYKGKFYQKKPNVAHAIFPPNSYHLPTTPDGKVLAIDWFGNLAWLKANAPRVKLYTFDEVNSEPWHTQCLEYPRGKSQYNPRIHHPVPVIPLPPIGDPAPATKLFAPAPTLRVGQLNNVAQVREFQIICNFFGWTDAYGMKLLVDGNYGLKSASACKNMQGDLKIYQDGVYGPQSYRALQAHLTALTTLKAA